MYVSVLDYNVMPRQRPESPARRHARTQGRRLLVGAGAFLFLAFALAQVAQGSAPSGFDTIQVQPGDSLWSIAAQRYPSADTRAKIDEIVRANNLNGEVLRVGEELKVPAD